METEHRERHGLVWPVMLIGTGVVLLLSNTGRLPWGVWQTLLSLWPVLLIAAGLDLLFGRRSTWGALLAALLALAVLVGALLSITVSYFFYFNNIRLRVLLTSMLATFIGLLTFAIVIFDQPERGELRVKPSACELVLDKVMHGRGDSHDTSP